MAALHIDAQDRILSMLRQVVGHENFHKGQRDIIENIMAGSDGLVILHTGGGKTLCFTLPALLT